MIVTNSNRYMHHSDGSIAGTIGGSLCGVIHFLSVDSEAILNSHIPWHYRFLIFVIVTFAGGVFGNLGKDFYNRFFKLKSKSKDRDRLNGPGTADSTIHQRKLLAGSRYEKLIPKPKNRRIVLEQGNTDTTLEIMDRTARKYSTEASRLAPVLSAGSREKTVASIKDFLYNHFQYLADTDWQLIRVLSRAWQDRREGIDCKSYSVIASQILLELGIPHYFARIKQKGDGSQNSAPSDSWSHVFVVVPKEGELLDPNDPSTYWTLDGVPKYDHVPPYLEINFYPMLKHAVLNGPAALGKCGRQESLPSEPIIEEVSPSSSTPGTYVIVIADKHQTSLPALVAEVSKDQLTQVVQTGCECTDSALGQLNGLGFPWAQAAQVALQIGSSLAPLFASGEDDRFNKLRSEYYGRNWPNRSGYGWQNYAQAPTNILQDNVDFAYEKVTELKGRIDAGAYKDSGEKRVWQRYLKVYSEALQAMATELGNRESNSGSGLNTGGSVGRGGDSGAGNDSSINTPVQASIGGFGGKYLGWLAIAAIGYAGYKLVSDGKEAEEAKSNQKRVKATV